MDLEFVEFPTGEHWVRGETNKAAVAAIDQSDSSLFGSTSGKTTAINYLRWGKQTYANVRPCRYMKGFKSPLANPDGIDFVIVRENLEDLYLGLEGPMSALAPLHLHSRILRAELDTSERGHLRDQDHHRAQEPADSEIRFRTGAQAQGQGPSGQSHLYFQVQHAAGIRRIVSPDRRGDLVELSRYHSMSSSSSTISPGGSCKARIASTSS